MANDAEKRVRFDRVISALRGVIDSLTAQESAWEEFKKGTVGVYAGSAIACSKARQAFEDETPTMDALVIALRDNRYKDTTWPTDDMDDAKTLRIAWYAIHNTIEAGKSFAPDAIGMMRNLCAALERAQESCGACSRGLTSVESQTAAGSDEQPMVETVDQAALRLVAGSLAQSGVPGLAAILSSAPSAERASVEMIRLCESDDNYYAWSAEDWRVTLGVTKRIIIGNPKNGIPPCRGWSQVLEWRASNKQHRQSLKKPRLVP